MEEHRETYVFLSCAQSHSGSRIIEGRYFNYMTMEEIIDLINSVSKNIEVIDCFENLLTLERNMLDIIWGNVIVKKIEVIESKIKKKKLLRVFLFIFRDND